MRSSLPASTSSSSSSMLDVNVGSMNSSSLRRRPSTTILPSSVGTERPPVDLLDVVARLHLADDLGVRAGAADAALLELADERAFVVARRRLRELLLGEHAGRRDELEGCRPPSSSGSERLALGAAPSAFAAPSALLSSRLLGAGLRLALDARAVDLEPAGELQHAPARAEHVRASAFAFASMSIDV